jgi:glycosyltransferase involved in cell wall biosynthesis
MKKILINAILSKVKSGGGFQISLNFIRQSIKQKQNDVEWYYFVSEDLDKVINNEFSEIKNIRYFVFPNQPDLKTYFNVRKNVRKIENNIKPNLVYSILSPSYFSFKTVEVMRIANAWNTNPNRFALTSLTLNQKIFFSLKRQLTCFLMQKSKYFFTQSETLKRGIKEIAKVPSENIKVVSNVLPATFNNSKIEKRELKDKVNIVYVSAPHPHKKNDIIPFVAKCLVEKYKIKNFRFYITIPKNHPYLDIFNGLLHTLKVEDFVENVGYKKQDELIELYNNSHIGFFPSLLETFSATLLEYMYFQLPIVASDFNFNTEVSKDAALYFEPNNVEEAAEKLYLLMTDRKQYNNLVEKSKYVLIEFSDYNDHFNQTVDFLLDVIEK